jgi:hypothetical protein
MGYVIKAHHPELTEEEREIRIENIKKALVEFYKQVIKEKEENGK